MSELVKINHDGTKNAVILAAGNSATEGVHKLIDFASLVHEPKKIRIDSITYSLEKPASLWWVLDDTGVVFIMPLDGRGFLNFEGYQSLNSPARAVGINVRLTPGSAYFLMLDLVKQ